MRRNRIGFTRTFEMRAVMAIEVSRLRNHLGNVCFQVMTKHAWRSIVGSEAVSPHPTPPHSSPPTPLVRIPHTLCDPRTKCGMRQKSEAGALIL